MIVKRRTILIFPEFENINIINEIRKKYDPLADLILPHITLVFPFESELSNEELKLYLEECLSDVHPFKIELEGFTKKDDRYGYYLFLNVVKGTDIIKNIHEILYKDKLQEFNLGYEYVPHMIVGKLPSIELLDKAFEDVIKYRDKFSTLVKKISVETIGENEELIIIIEKELS